MKKLLLASVFALTTTMASAETEIRVHYSIPTIWAETQDKLAAAFMAANPDVKIVLDGPAENYEEGVQRLLRESVAGTAPDVAFVGLNNWRILEDRGLLKPLDGFLPSDPAAAGYTPALLSLGRFEDKQWGLATSASTLVLYVNPKLVEQAGGSMENFPSDFEGIIELAAKIDALGDNVEGIWIAPHDWRFQSLLGSNGGRPLNADESDITFDSQAGVAAATLYSRFAKEAGMSTMTENDARQAFPAGTLGMFFESSSLLKRFTEGSAGNFDIVVKGTPVVDEKNAYFPTGGAAMVILTDDAGKQDAAWKYMTFVTGPEGQKVIVENTGFAPANKLVVDDAAYLGDYYAANPNAKVGHAQVASFAGPWYAYPGAEGVAVTDLIAASLVEIVAGAEPKATVDALAETVRNKLNMN